MSVYAVLLAGGSSSRFSSPTPKALFPLQGKPLIEYLLDTIKLLSVDKTFIVSGERTHQYLVGYVKNSVEIIRQKQALGTFDALLTAIKQINTLKNKPTSLLVINADTPLIRVQFLQSLLNCPNDNVIATQIANNPYGLGRIIYNSVGQLKQIVEQKELSSNQHFIHDVNAGIYKLNFHQINAVINKTFDTAERYLTSYLGNYKEFTLPCRCVSEEPQWSWTLSGINTYEDFELLEDLLVRSQRQNLVQQGAYLENSSTIVVKGSVNVSPGVKIIGPCVLEGPLTLEAGTIISPFSIVKSSHLEPKTTLESFCLVEHSVIGTSNKLGPFLRTRHNVRTGDGVQLGNFLEIKNSTIGTDTKIKHFGYIGDGYIGSHCNIGAGVIFCNYDGKEKHTTTIGDHVFVGAASQFVAPLDIGNQSYIGASTLVTRSLDRNTLALRRAVMKTTIKSMSE